MNDLFEIRRKKLQDDVRTAVLALFEHMGTAGAFIAPLDKAAGLYVAAGPMDRIRKLVERDT
jgi:hypothetical protein